MCVYDRMVFNTQEVADYKQAFTGLQKDTAQRLALIGAVFHAPPEAMDKMQNVLLPEPARPSCALSRAAARSRSPALSRKR